MDPAELLPSFGHLALFPHIRDLGIAYALAFLIGWNRERHARSAGLRTFPLVAVAACGFIQATERLTADHPDSLARIIAGIITGMGFIGGGAILKNGGEVHGMATAAALWATGCIGVAIAVQAYDVAVVITGFTVVTLYALGSLKRDHLD
jgi:putative Mg2+ transporter-C (MgtC) family protein